jgi:hypothetical protein
MRGTLYFFVQRKRNIMTTSSERFILTPDNKVYLEKTELEELTGGSFTDALLKDKVKDFAFLSPMLNLGDQGEVIRVACRIDSAPVSIIRLKYFNFHAQWTTPEENNIIRPSFDSLTEGDAINPVQQATDLLWEIPNNFPHYLVYINAYDVFMYGYPNPKHYPKVSISDSLAYRLPVPNVFENGRICYNLPEDQRGQSLPVAELQRYYRNWFNSKWNRDLYRPDFETLFKWEADTGKQLPWNEVGVEERFEPIRITADAAWVHKLLWNNLLTTNGENA